MPARPRIVIVTTSYPTGPDDPAGHFVRAEAEALVRGGADVTVLCPGRPLAAADTAPQVVRLGDHDLFGWPGAIPRLREDPRRVLGLGSFIARARGWLKRAGPLDRVIAHWIVPCAWPIGVATRHPLEVVAHGSDVRLLLRAPTIARVVVVQLLRRGARFRFVSHRLRDELCQIVGEPLVVASRVELPSLELPRVPTRSAARDALAIPAEARVTVVVARLISGKRLATALNAATLVPGSRVVVLGDGSLRQALAARFDDVDFVGHQSRDRALTWLAAADVLITASRAEGAPTVVREARALGIPVVAAPAGDLADWSSADPELYVIAAGPGATDALD